MVKPAEYLHTAGGNVPVPLLLVVGLAVVVQRWNVSVEPDLGLTSCEAIV